MQLVRNMQAKKHIRKNNRKILYTRYSQPTIIESMEESDVVHWIKIQPYLMI